MPGMCQASIACLVKRSNGCGLARRLVGVVCQRHKVGIVLAAALKHQEVIVAATAVPRKRPTDRRTRCVDGAAALFSVKEAADAAVVFIAFAAHGVFATVGFTCEGFLRFLEGHVVMFGKALYIALVKCDQRVGTTVARTFSAIVHGSCRPSFFLESDCRIYSAMNDDHSAIDGVASSAPAASFVERIRGTKRDEVAFDNLATSNCGNCLCCCGSRQGAFRSGETPVARAQTPKALLTCHTFSAMVGPCRCCIDEDDCPAASDGAKRSWPVKTLSGLGCLARFGL